MISLLVFGEITARARTSRLLVSPSYRRLSYYSQIIKHLTARFQRGGGFLTDWALRMKTNNSTNKAKLFTRGGQITFNNWRMLLQVNQKIAHAMLLITALLFGVILWWMSSVETLKAGWVYAVAKVFSKVGLGHRVLHFHWHERLLPISVKGILQQAYFKQQVALLLHQSKIALMLAGGLAFLLTAIFSVWLIRRGRQQAEKRFVRGSRIASPKVLRKAIEKYGASDIRIARVPMVKDFEVKHTLIHGTTGSGKGQTFNQFIEQIRQRGDNAIIFDKGCIFTSLFYQPKRDVILNPFDARCAPWDIWAESASGPDFENMAESLIPMHGESDPYWVDAARTVFSSTAYRMREESDRSVDKLLSLLLTADLDVMGEYLKGTQAATLVSDKIEKTAISIRSVLSTYLKSLRFLQGLKAKDGQAPFAIRHWIQQIADARAGHCLFISSNAEQHAALRPLMSMWLSLASIALLSLEENFERRIWFIADELPTLHKLPQLGETIAEVRKFGGCFILGMQSFSQLQKIYGRACAAEMFDLLNTRFFFRSPSADMAALVSRECGQEDIEQSQESYSYGANTVSDGISIGTQRLTRPLVSPAEVMELPDLTAYLRVPAPVPITQLVLRYQNRPKIAAGFLLRESVSRPQKTDAVIATDGAPIQAVLDGDDPMARVGSVEKTTDKQKNTKETVAASKTGKRKKRKPTTTTGNRDNPDNTHTTVNPSSASTAHSLPRDHGDPVCAATPPKVDEEIAEVMQPVPEEYAHSDFVRESKRNPRELTALQENEEKNIAFSAPARTVAARQPDHVMELE